VIVASKPDIVTGPAETVPAPVSTAPPREPEFQDLGGAQAQPLPPSAANGTLDRLLDVTVDVSVELGRAVRSIADVMKFGPGTVVELDRAISEPVDLIVQGVHVARGEVVVVDDHFAIRISEILDPRQGGTQN